MLLELHVDSPWHLLQQVVCLFVTLPYKTSHHPCKHCVTVRCLVTVHISTCTCYHCMICRHMHPAGPVHATCTAHSPTHEYPNLIRGPVLCCRLITRCLPWILSTTRFVWGLIELINRQRPVLSFDPCVCLLLAPSDS